MADIRIENGKPVFRNGDFLLNSPEDALEQEVSRILTISKGTVRSFPLTGVGIEEFLKSSGQEEVQLLRERISLQLELDEIEITSMEFPNGMENFELTFRR